MTNALEMRHIRKYFPSSGVLACDDVSLNVHKGEVHAIVGENGAGKTTLMSILYGLVTPDEGEILVNETPVRIAHPHDAIKHGIGMVHQHFKLVPSFTIAENIMLGIEPNRGGFIDSATEAENVRKLADSFGLPVDPNARIRDISVGIQQRVEILKILQRDAQILVLDEPTAVLTPQEVKELLSVVRSLAETGRTILFISHKLAEVKAVADNVTIMRRGQNVGSYATKGISIRETANMMVGRVVNLQVEKTPAKPGAVVLSADNLLVAGMGGVPAVFGASLEVRSGEILGLAGVSGNGQTELVEAVVGLRPVDQGTINFLGHDITHSTVRERRDTGVAHIPEDRMTTGLNLKTNLDENVVVTSYQLPPYSKRGVLQLEPIRQLARDIVQKFSVKSARVGAEIKTLSGGNLQKIVLGRELKGDPKLIIANQPTRGLDVGSIEFVHKTLVEERDKGAAVLLVSVELDEIFALSDRIAVMYAGKIVAVLDAKSVTEEQLGLLMAGSSLEHAEVAAEKAHS
ncbi:MAG: ABC transporter ATP-binding protein [Chloroflexi bacterium]|uniref:ABC transporter ATP-binding protein n=1 Tax=Candidatus Flexifilum breve TaxID=3140694 RepID=UPI003134CB38|nr:ABC transporter ATP-binding protein [Chloroflexota bacterium]MBK9745330.1 ABC transporter ATP-binding protein [Chloroflexota bacterium]